MLATLRYNDTATTHIYTLSLHDALPIFTSDELRQIERLVNAEIRRNEPAETREMPYDTAVAEGAIALFGEKYERSEEHTSELQSRRDLVCRLLLEKKKISPVAATCSQIK